MKAAFLDFDTLGPSDIDISPLTDLLPDLQFFPHTPTEKLAARIAATDIIIINKARLDATLLRASDQLTLICLAATGTDNVSLTAAAEKGIAVCNVRDYCTPSVIQHVFATLLALTHHLREYDMLMRSGAWPQGSQFCLLDYPIRETER